MFNTDEGLNLTSVGSDAIGFDLSPPSTKFADNMTASNGNNYLALFDFEVDGNAYNGTPGISAELKYPLIKDVDYTFVWDIAIMNLLDEIKDNEGWNSVKNNIKINVIFTMGFSDNVPKQTLTLDVDSENWTTQITNFKAQKNFTHIHIKFNPIISGVIDLVVKKSRIAGVFIDNLKLYETCENPQNQCANANYRHDMLDAKLQKVELSSPYAYPDPEDNSNDLGILKSIRAIGLDNVKHFEMRITNDADGNDNVVLHRQIIMDYPPSTYVWDGRDDNGNMMPDGDYEAHLIALSNDCHYIQFADDKDFKLKSKYSVFDVGISNFIDDGNALIYGLENVHSMNIKIYMTNGDLVHSFDIANPRSSVALSIESLLNTPGSPVIVEGNYGIAATLINNCDHSSRFEATRHIGHKLTGQDASYEALYDYASVPKSDFPCPFNALYHQNLLPPMNCCEGDLYLNNVEIWTSWVVNIQNNIYIGPNTTFVNGAVNELYAGQQIILDPTDESIVLNNETILKPKPFDCPICKLYEVTVIDEEEAEGMDRELISLYNDSINGSDEFVLYPTPYFEGDITILSKSSKINEKDLRLELTNAIGVPVSIIVGTKSPRMVKLKLLEKVATGIYYLRYSSGGLEQTFTIVIN